MSQETVFRIDALIGGHAAGFKVAAKEAAKAATDLRNDVAKYSAAQATANNQSNKAKDSLAKFIVAQRDAKKEVEQATKADEIAADVSRQRQKATREVLRELRRQAIVERLRERATEKATNADADAGVQARLTARAFDDESKSAIEAAASLGVKAKETDKTRDRQAELAAVAKLVAAELEGEANAARHAALMLAMKGHESKKTADDQARLVVQVARSRAAMENERKTARELSFDLQKHRGVLASNIRSQPLFAAAVASTTAALGPLASGLGDAAAGAVALGGGLEPLMGNLVLIPAIVGAAGQGMLTLGIGLHGVFKTLRAQGATYENNLKKLSKPAQEFVKILRGKEFGNAFKELQLQIQSGLFPGLVKGLRAAMPLLKPFSQVMWDTARAIGHLAEIWGKFFGSKKFGSDFLQIGERNRQTLYRLGVAARDIFKGITNVLVAAGPFIGQWTKMIQDAASWFEQFTRKARASGDLREYFKEVWHRTQQWLSILKSTITFFHNLFTAAKPLTDVIMNAWVKGAKAASDWAKNSQPLKDFFVSAKAPLEAMGRLVGALATALAQLASENQSNLVLLADALSQHVVPALQAVAEFFAKLIPDIAKALSTLGDSLKTILQNSGDIQKVLKWILKFIQGVASAAAEISKHIGGLGLVIVGAATLGGLRVGISLMRTLIKLARDKAFEKVGINIVGDALTLNRGKGLGKFIPGGKKAAQQAAARNAPNFVSEAARTAAGVGTGAGVVGAVTGRAAIMAGLRTASIRAVQIFAGGATKVPLIAAGASLVDFVIQGINGHDKHVAAAKALTQVFTGGLKDFKDYKQIDDAGNKMMDTLIARVQDIAKRKKLSIPVDFDIKGGTHNAALTEFIRQLESSVSTTKVKTQTWKSYFDELKINVGMNMKRIALTTKAGSEDARMAMAANFNTAAAAVAKSMQDAGHFTATGVATITKYLRDALALYGIKGRDATAYISTYIYRKEHPGNTGTGANEGSNPGVTRAFKADGGFVTAPGLRGKDNRRVMLGDGEAVLNHHQQGPVDAALRQTYGMGLRDLFDKEKRPHYMNAGGFVGNPRYPMLSGDLDFGTNIGNKLERMAEQAKTRIFVQDGGRTLKEQAVLYAKYGPGRAAAPSPNAPHVKGIAADITPGQAVFGSLAGSFGMGFPVPGEPWHIQLTDGSAGGVIAAVKDAIIKRVNVGGAGVPGQLAQGAVDNVQSAAQAILDSVATGPGSGGDGVSPGGITGKGHPGRNMSIARGMMAAYKWGADQWPSLKSLWTKESGWDEFAVNKGSGAAGIPQALGHGNVFALGDAQGQIDWGLKYIRDRYGSPSAAWAHEQAYNWYGLGGIVGNPRMAHSAGRTPPPNVPLSQAPSVPQKTSRAMNPLTHKYETHSKSDWETIREKAAAQRGKKIGPTGPPPIGLKHKVKPKQERKVAHTKKFRKELASITTLSDEAPLVDPTIFTAMVERMQENIATAKSTWGLSDEQQTIGGLFNIATGKQVPPMPSYDSGLFEIKDVINQSGGTDATSLKWIPGIDQHVAELMQELGMEGHVNVSLQDALSAYKTRGSQMIDRVARRMAVLKELADMVTLWKKRKAAAQKQYDSQKRKKGTYQDRIAANDDEIDDLQTWLRHNSSANSDQAKAFKIKARDRVASLRKQNKNLNRDKPPPSKSAGEALHRIEVYGGELKTITGNADPDDVPGDILSWKAGGKVSPIISTINTLTGNIKTNSESLDEIRNQQIPTNFFNQGKIRDEIADWTGTVLPAQAIGTSGNNAELAGLLKEQLIAALQTINLQDMQMGVFRGLAPYIGRFQHGGWVPQSGMAMLEKGEYVIPEPDGPNPQYSQQASAPAVNVTLVLDGHAASLVKLVDQRIDSKAPMTVSQVLGRKGRMIANAPGRP